MSNSNDQGKAEDFKRATAGALRAIAQVADIQVAYQPGPAGLSGKRARLPAPSRALAAPEMAKLRGAADALALRLRHHDDAIHAARSPASREAREAYDALEQARVESLGAEHMAGVSANLRGKLNEECAADGLDRMTNRDQLPLVAALSLLARDQMDPASVPASARAIVDLWRGTLGENAQAALADLAANRADQAQYTTSVRKLLAALELAEAESEPAEEEEDGESEDGSEETSQQDNSQDGDGQQQSQENAMLAAQPEMMEGESADQNPEEEGETDDAAAEAEDAPAGPQQRRATGNNDDQAGYRAFTRSSTSNCSICTPSSPNSPTACNAACWPSKPAPGSSTWRKACWTPPGYPASSSIRCSR
jgi:cobaltochelatase CobT